MSKTHSPTEDRLRLPRLARGFSQTDLARAAGVTRQAISGIESGRWSPSLVVGLSLARALDTSVEELFSSPTEEPSVTARLAPQTARQHGGTNRRRLLLSDVAGDTTAFPISRDGSFVPGFVPALGMVGDATRASNGGADPASADATEGNKIPSAGKRPRHDQRSVTAIRIAEAMPTLAIAGCDPALGLLQAPLARHKPPLELLWWQCGNAMALELLENGAVHAAAVHRGVGTRTRARPGVAAVGFAAWREGLAIAPGQRGKVRDLREVVGRGLRIANRERGSEARAGCSTITSTGSGSPRRKSPAMRRRAQRTCSSPRPSGRAWRTPPSRPSQPLWPSGSTSSRGRRRSASSTSLAPSWGVRKYAFSSMCSAVGSCSASWRFSRATAPSPAAGSSWPERGRLLCWCFASSFTTHRCRHRE